MKKTVLCCLLTICLLLAGPANAQNLSVNIRQINPMENIRSLCWVEDTLYILGSYGLYRWDAAERSIAPVVDLHDSASYQSQEQKPNGELEAEAWSKAIQHLFSDGKELYTLQPYSGEVFVLSGAALESTVHIPTDILFADMGGRPFFRGIIDLAYAGDKLYLLLGTDDMEQWEKTSLFSFDMGTKEVTESSVEGVSYLLPSDDGELDLGVAAEGTPGISICSYTADSDIMGAEVLLLENTLQGSPLWYRAENSIVFVSNGVVSKLQPGGTQFAKAYLPLGGFGTLSTKPACSPSGVYASSSASYLYLRDIAGDSKPNVTILHCAGDFSPTLLADFGAAYPDIALVSTGLGQDIQLALQTSGSDIDICVVQAPGVYANLLHKGYAAALNESAALVEKARQFYPTLQEAVFQGNNLMAYPLTLQTQSWSLNTTQWELFGFSEVPVTYADLFDGMITWDDDFADEYPDYKYLDMQESAYGFVSALIREYVLQNEMPDSPLSFDTPEFREALGLVISNQQLIEDNAENYGMPIIFTYSMGFGITSNDGEQVTMLAPPALNDNREQTLATSAEMVIINSASEKKAEALLFLEYLASTMPTQTAYMINPSLNDPVRSSTYEDRHSQLEAEIERLRKQLETADESKLAELQDTLSQRESALVRLEKNQWEISQESIESYRSIAENLKIPYWSVFLSDAENSGMTVIAPIIQKFCDQGMQASNVDLFIQDLDRVARMIFLERQ